MKQPLLLCAFSLLLNAAGAPGNSATLRPSPSFEPNLGQAAKPVRFIARAGVHTLFLTSGGVVVAKHNGDPLEIELTGSDPAASAEGTDPQPGVANYLLGNRPQGWTLGVPRYAKVRYRQVYPGVDLMYYFNGENLEHDFVLAPGARWNKIRFRVKGARRLRMDSNGDLLIETSSGTLREKKPTICQEGGGRKATVAGGYAIRGREFHFDIGDYDVKEPLVIDPVILFSTYLGGSGVDVPNAIAMDAQGNAYVAGATTSANFPTQGALQGANAGNADAFVTKINPITGQIVYSTYIGGANNDIAAQIAVDSSGSAIVVGTTYSTNFPVTGKIQPNPGGGDDDAFVLKLNPAGNALVYSTYLGGSGDESAWAVDLDSQGNAYVAGVTSSTDFPISLALQNVPGGGGSDGFLTKINSAGTQMVYSTYFGGRGADAVTSIAVNSLNEVIMVGFTTSPDLPTTVDGSRWPNLAGEADGFMVRIADTGAYIEYISYYGGSLNDECTSVAVDLSDPSTVYIGTLTESPDFPTADGSPTDLTPGYAETYFSKFVLPSNSPDVVVRRSVARIDDYDFSKKASPPSTQSDQGLPPFKIPPLKIPPFPPFPKFPNPFHYEPPGPTPWHFFAPPPPPPPPAPTDPDDLPGDISAPRPVPADTLSSAPVTVVDFDSNGDSEPAVQLPAGSASATTGIYGMAVDPSGNLYMAIQTNDTTLPVSSLGSNPRSTATTGYIIGFATGTSTTPAISFVANAFGGSATIAPNTWVKILGSSLAPAGDSRSWQASDFNGNQMPTELDGVSATVNGLNAYIEYISYGQVNILTPPYPMSGPVNVVLTNSDGYASFTAQAAAISPSFFVFDGTHVVAQHLNYTDVGPTTLYPGLTTPAKPDEEVILYANGFGQTSESPLAGSAVQGGTLATFPVVTIGNLPAQVTYAGLAGVGEFQFNVTVPATAPDGDLPLVATYNGVSTPSGVVITVQH